MLPRLITTTNIEKRYNLQIWRNVQKPDCKRYRLILDREIGAESGGSPGTCSPIIKLGAKPLFCPQSSRGKFSENVKKRNKRQRNKILSESHQSSMTYLAF